MEHERLPKPLVVEPFATMSWRILLRVVEMIGMKWVTWVKNVRPSPLDLRLRNSTVACPSQGAQPAYQDIFQKLRTKNIPDKL